MTNLLFFSIFCTHVQKEIQLLDLKSTSIINISAPLLFEK